MANPKRTPAREYDFDRLRVTIARPARARGRAFVSLKSAYASSTISGPLT